LFGRGCRSQDNWKLLCRGPYGADLIHHAWSLFAPMNWPAKSWLDLTLSALFVNRQTTEHWNGKHGEIELLQQIRSDSVESISRALLTLVGLTLAEEFTPKKNWAASNNLPLLDAVEAHVHHDDPAVWDPAIWAWARIRESWTDFANPRPQVLNTLLSKWLGGEDKSGNVGYALTTLLGLERSIWKPLLTEDQKRVVRLSAETAVRNADHETLRRRFAGLLIAFHSGDVLPEAKLVQLLRASRNLEGHVYDSAVDAMIKQLRVADDG
jgi:hypothetical protein